MTKADPFPATILQMEVGTEIREKPPKPSFQLQSPLEFRDNFVQAAQIAQNQVGIETMQYEVCDETRPIFESLLNTDATSVRFQSDRVAGSHIAVGDSKAIVLKGLTLPYKGTEWGALQRASNEREMIMRKLKDRGIGFEGEKHGLFRHNHVKLAIADNVAWFGTMNLRKLDFDISNFMMKVEDPYWVDVLKDVFDQTEQSGIVEDRIFKKDDSSDTELLLDAGVPKQSAIFQRAHEMVRSMKEGDEFVYVGQWPPVRVMMGSLLDAMQTKADEGVNGTFLMSPEDELHPIGGVSNFLQRKVDKKFASNPHLTAENLPVGTHAKILMIKRKDGSREVLFGSHNLTSWTVWTGTRELSMWTKDPVIVEQLNGFVEGVKKLKQSS